MESIKISIPNTNQYSVDYLYLDFQPHDASRNFSLVCLLLCLVDREDILPSGDKMYLRSILELMALETIVQLSRKRQFCIHHIIVKNDTLN